MSEEGLVAFFTRKGFNVEGFFAEIVQIKQIVCVRITDEDNLVQLIDKMSDETA